MKSRPCIIVDIPEEDEPRNNALSICAMATYEGVPIEETPEVYQHFSVGISPNTDDPVHVHTMPEWTGTSRQWVIAYAYDVSPQKYNLWTISRWYNRHVDGPFEFYSYHRLSPAMLSYLEDVFRKKFDEWQKKCQSDPDLVSRSFAQVNVQLRGVNTRDMAAYITI